MKPSLSGLFNTGLFHIVLLSLCLSFFSLSSSQEGRQAGRQAEGHRAESVRDNSLPFHFGHGRPCQSRDENRGRARFCAADRRCQRMSVIKAPLSALPIHPSIPPSTQTDRGHSLRSVCTEWVTATTEL